LLASGPAAERAGAPAARAAPAPGADEFSQFLTDVTTTVGKAVEAWRARVSEAVLRWQGQGYRTRRLEALLEHDTPVAVDAAITSFTADVERLQALEREVSLFDPQAAGQSVFRDPERRAEAEEVAARVRQGVAPPPAPSTGFPLDAFAVGPSNDMVMTAVREVVSQPGKRYNPLVLVGPSGRGKSHLLHGLGLELGRAKGAVVACLSTQTFIDELIAAIDGNRMEWWRARYRRATALLLDDIHLLAEKERTQEEFFNLFNLLLEQDRQLVFTAPAAPATLTGVDARLVTRLEGGLVVELGPPDRDVRRGVLARYCAGQRIDVDDALLDYLADRPVDSTRELGNMVQRVVAHAAAQALPVTAGLARTVLAGQGEDRRAATTRTGGVVVSSAGGVRSREKIVWEWPAPGDRILEARR
jgi:chromosomal replication initiator protein